MLADCFAFTVRIGGQVNRLRFLRRRAQLAHNFFLRGNDGVLRGEVVVDIHSQLVLGEILDMTYRGLDRVSTAQVFRDGPGLGGRLNDDE